MLNSTSTQQFIAELSKKVYTNLGGQIASTNNSVTLQSKDMSEIRYELITSFTNELAVKVTAYVYYNDKRVAHWGAAEQSDNELLVDFLLEQQRLYAKIERMLDDEAYEAEKEAEKSFNAL